MNSMIAFVEELGESAHASEKNEIDYISCFLRGELDSWQKGMKDFLLDTLLQLWNLQPCECAT